MKNLNIYYLLVIIFLNNSYLFSNEFNNTGATGAPGAIGIKGNTGLTGLDGNNGPEGPMGGKGVPGINLINSTYLYAYHTRKQNIQNSSNLNAMFSNIIFENISISNGIITPNFSHFTPIQSGTYQFKYILFFLINISSPVNITVRAAKGPYIAYLKPGMPIPISENNKEIIFNDIQGTDQTIALGPNTGISDPSALSTGIVVGDFTIDLASNESIVIQATANGLVQGGTATVEAPSSISSTNSVNATLIIKKIS